MKRCNLLLVFCIIFALGVCVSENTCEALEIYTYYAQSGNLESKTLSEADKSGNTYYYYEDDAFYVSPHGGTYGRLLMQMSVEPSFEGYRGVQYEYYGSSDTVKTKHCYENADYSDSSNPTLNDLVSVVTYYNTPWLFESVTYYVLGGGGFDYYSHYMEESFHGSGMGRTDIMIFADPDDIGATAYEFEYYPDTDTIYRKYCYERGDRSDPSMPAVGDLILFYEYDSFDRLTRKEYADGSAWVYEWEYQIPTHMRMESWPEPGDMRHYLIYENGQDYNLENANTWPLVADISFFESGNVSYRLEPGILGDNIYHLYIDEDYYDYHGYGMGRLEMVTNLANGSFSTFSYFGNTERISSYYIHDSIPNINYTYDFYDEEWPSNNKGIITTDLNCGRVYTYLKNDWGISPEDKINYGYIWGTAKELITYDKLLSQTYGAGTLYYYYEEDLEDKNAIRVELDEGRICELTINGDNVFLQKVIDNTADTCYWFLWGEDVYEGYDNVVIEYNAGDWMAYHDFNPDTQNPDNVFDNSSWIAIGTIPEPNLSILPELGDWWDWVIENNVVPEFPPLSSDYTYDNDRVIERIDHNPYTDTTYTCEWDYQGAGQVKINMSYDYNDDSNIDLISTRVYNNDADYDIENIGTWELLSESSKYYKNGVFKRFVTSLYESDFNLDGRVDLNDFAILRSRYGTTEGATRLTGDTNRDGRVDSEDYGNFVGQFGLRNLLQGADIVLKDKGDNVVVKIFASDGHREIYIYTDGLFTEEDLLVSGILNPTDVIIDNTVSAAPENLVENGEESVVNSATILGDQEVIARLETQTETIATRNKSKFTYYSDLKPRKTKYLDWLKN